MPSRTKASAGAIRCFQMLVSTPLWRRKNPITASETVVISRTRPRAPLLVSQVNMVSTGYSSPSSEPEPASANPIGQDHGNGCLGERTGERCAAAAADRGQRCRYNPFAAEGEEIAGDGVVEADQRRENAGDKEDLGQIAEQDGTVGLQEDKHQVRSALR